MFKASLDDETKLKVASWTLVLEIEWQSKKKKKRETIRPENTYNIKNGITTNYINVLTLLSTTFRISLSLSHTHARAMTYTLSNLFSVSMLHLTTPFSRSAFYSTWFLAKGNNTNKMKLKWKQTPVHHSKLNCKFL